MERRKRVYQNRKEYGKWFQGALAVLTAIIILSGLAERRKTGDFLLEPELEKAQLKLEESFDETMTEAVIELQSYHWYAIQVGVFEKEETAKQSSAAFQKRGAAGYLWKDGRYRVLASAYPEKEDAQLVRQQLQDQHGIDSYLHQISFPALKLRMRGMQGQLDIVQAALTHLHDLVSQVQSLSVRMDRQELSAIEAMDTLNVLKEQIQIVAIRIEQRFSMPRNETVQAIANGLNGYVAFVSALSTHESSLSMGMKLKYQVFVILSDIQKVYDTLTHT